MNVFLTGRWKVHYIFSKKRRKIDTRILREINVLLRAYKVFERILYNRLCPHLQYAVKPSHIFIFTQRQLLVITSVVSNEIYISDHLIQQNFFHFLLYTNSDQLFLVKSRLKNMFLKHFSSNALFKYKDTLPLFSLAHSLLIFICIETLT